MHALEVRSPISFFRDKQWLFQSIRNAHEKAGLADPSYVLSRLYRPHYCAQDAFLAPRESELMRVILSRLLIKDDLLRQKLGFGEYQTTNCVLIYHRLYGFFF